MSLRNLPNLPFETKVSSLSFDLRADALQKWSPQSLDASQSDDTAISIYDVIGDSWDGEGVTAKRISAALRKIGSRDITVNINSPGGDFFEGVAIYNLLRNHPAKVTVRVLGVAASAASIIAMAGDEIQIGDGAFLMIHNAWVIAMGNRNDLQSVADTLAGFDAAMADLYANRTGIDKNGIAAMMDKETWLSASQAVEMNFADSALAETAIDQGQNNGRKKAMAQIEAAMIHAGYSRSARRETFKNLFCDMPSAVAPATPCAGDLTASLANLLTTIKSPATF